MVTLSQGKCSHKTEFGLRVCLQLRSSLDWFGRQPLKLECGGSNPPSATNQRAKGIKKAQVNS